MPTLNIPHTQLGRLIQWISIVCLSDFLMCDFSVFCRIVYVTTLINVCDISFGYTETFQYSFYTQFAIEKSNMCVRLRLLLILAWNGFWVWREKIKPNKISEANAIFINLIENERIECSMKQIQIRFKLIDVKNWSYSPFLFKVWIKYRLKVYYIYSVCCWLWPVDYRSSLVKKFYDFFSLTDDICNYLLRSKRTCQSPYYQN